MWKFQCLNEIENKTWKSMWHYTYQVVWCKNQQLQNVQMKQIWLMWIYKEENLLMQRNSFLKKMGMGPGINILVKRYKIYPEKNVFLGKLTIF